MMFNAGKGEAFAWDVPQTAGICGQMIRPYIRHRWTGGCMNAILCVSQE